MSRILVAGGRGFMGRRVVRLLKHTLPETEVLTAGRAPANDRRLDVRAPVAESLDGIDILINTVGPFDYDPTALVRACIDGKVHYLDLAETDAFLSRAGALQAGTAVVSGCSSVPGLIQALAGRWDGRSDVASVRAQLCIGTNNPGSATLLYSMLEPIGRRSTQGRWFDKSWLRDHGDLGKRRYARYPAGVVALSMGDREVPLQFGFGLDRGLYTLMLGLTAPLIGLLPRRLLRFEAWVMSLFVPLVRPLGTRTGILSLDAISAEGKVLDSIEVRARADGLDVPAWPCVWAAETLLADPRAACRLSELLTSPEVEAKLRSAGFEVVSTA